MEQLVEPLTIDLEQERKDILKKYRRLLRTAKPYLKDNDAKLIKKAFYTSVEAHKDMRRRSGEPYIYHPLAVAQIVVEEIGLGTTGIVAALLHDVVEDTPITVKDIEKAKVLLMKMHSLDEDTAFQLLRKNAMSHRMTMGEMARRLLDAQQLLSNHFKD